MKKLIILSIIAIGGAIGYFYAEYEKRKEIKEYEENNKIIDITINELENKENLK